MRPRMGWVCLVLAVLPACPDACLHQAPPQTVSQPEIFRPPVPKGPPASKVAPTPQHAGIGTFGGEIAYLGYDLEPAQPRVGGPVQVTYYFRVLKDVTRDWEIFVHIDDRGGGERINGDHYPVAGTLHTNAWKAGDYIADRFSFNLAPGQGKTPIDLWAGFYEGEERLPISNPTECKTDGNNRLLTGTIQAL